MSRYTSDSEDDYRSNKSSFKKCRSESSSSEDSYSQKRNNRKYRRSRSRSHDRNVHRSSRSSQKDRHDTTKSRNYSRRSKSPSHRNKWQRSQSRSRSRSGTKKTLLKSKRKYKSRSRSHSYSKRSRSRSRRKFRSRSRSNSVKKTKRNYSDKNGSSSDEERHKSVSKFKQVIRNVDSKKNAIPEDAENNITISSDDPIAKQIQLDEINAVSFTQKTFKSSKLDNIGSSSKHILLNNADGFNIGVLNNENATQSEMQNRKNETVFHDNIVFEDNELKIQKWVKKILKIRQKFFFSQRE